MTENKSKMTIFLVFVTLSALAALLIALPMTAPSVPMTAPSIEKVGLYK